MNRQYLFENSVLPRTLSLKLPHDIVGWLHRQSFAGRYFSVIRDFLGVSRGLSLDFTEKGCIKALFSILRWIDLGTEGLGNTPTYPLAMPL